MKKYIIFNKNIILEKRDFKKSKIIKCLYFFCQLLYFYDIINYIHFTINFS